MLSILKNKSDQYLWVFFSIDQFSFPKQASSLPESKFFIGSKSLKLVLELYKIKEVYQIITSNTGNNNVTVKVWYDF